MGELEALPRWVQDARQFAAWAIAVPGDPAVDISGRDQLVLSVVVETLPMPVWISRFTKVAAGVIEVPMPVSGAVELGDEITVLIILDLFEDGSIGERLAVGKTEVIATKDSRLGSGDVRQTV